MGKFTKILALVYVIIGLYFLNFPFDIISLDFLGGVGDWIVFLGGAIILIHGLIFLFKRAKKTFENF